ncbi:MAG: caspase family protein [Planctomycetes bacterium]|nr:caspase family protein [Planctomycetota bacterium]
MMIKKMAGITLRNLGILMVVSASIHQCRAQARDESWQVVICGGILQDAQASQTEARAIAGLSRFFTDQLGIDREAVEIVCDKQSPAFGPNATACTRESLERTLRNLVSDTRRIDRFVFYYTGQANREASTLRLNVRGEDIIHSELVQWLGAIKAKQRLIVLDCPCAGLALKDLADPNTIIVCSARGDQYDSPRFSDYFVPALLEWESDKDDDGRLSLLEAFQTTSRELDAYYAQEKCYKSENALLEDDGDGVPSQQPWLFAGSGKDGARAAQFYFRQTQATAPPQGQ